MSDESGAGQPTRPRAGTRFGPYVLRRLLGAGGFGEVYEAEDTAMHRVVALKLLSSSYSHNPTFRERLFREAYTAGRLHDAHVVPIHGCGEIDGQLYIDMRLIDGTDLQSTLDHGGAMPPARAVAIVRQIASALDAAHAETVIHRDVKPANILLGADDFACLVDFGLANAASDTKLTSEGATVGSFAYLAPERLASGKVTPGADVYALACVLYECLTGAMPFEGRTEIPALVAAHLTAPPPRPSQQRPGIPLGFDDVIARGMAKNPDDRFPSAGALATAAQRALNSPVPQGIPAPQQPPPPATQQWTQGSEPRRPVQPTMAGTHMVATPASTSRRRNIIAAAVVGVVVVVAVTAAVIGIAQSGDSGRAAAPTSQASQPNAAPSSPTAAPLNATPLPVVGMGLEGVAVDSSGNLYVVDALEKRVLKLPAGAGAAAELPFKGLVKPRYVAADGTGAVYVVDWGTGGRGRVLKMAAGATSATDVPVGAILANGIAADNAGNLYIATADKVLEVATDATTPTLLPFTGGRYQGIAVDSSGNVYVSEQGGVLKLVAGAANPVQLPFGQLSLARSLAVDPRGTVYVVDNAGSQGRLVKLDPGAATSTLVAAPEKQEFGGVAIDAAGTVYLTENNRLLKVAPG